MECEVWLCVSDSMPQSPSVSGNLACINHTLAHQDGTATLSCGFFAEKWRCQAHSQFYEHYKVTLCVKITLHQTPFSGMTYHSSNVSPRLYYLQIFICITSISEIVRLRTIVRQSQMSVGSLSMTISS